MTLLKKYILILIIPALVFSGCKKTSSSASNDSKASSGTIQTSSPSTGLSYETNTPIVTPDNSANVLKSASIIQNGNSIYYSNWSDGEKLYTINANGTSKQKLNDASAEEFILSNNTIYFSNKSDALKLYSLSLDGTEKKQLTDVKATNLIMIGNLIYFINSSNLLSVLNVDTGIIKSLGINSRHFDIYGAILFYENFTSEQLSLNSVNIDGTNITKLLDDAPLGIASDADAVYYVNAWDGNKIYKISSDGQIKTKLNDFKSSGLTINSGWLYYINNSDFDKLYKIKSDGTSNTKLSDESFVKAFTVAGNFVYFDKATDINHPIYKVNK